MDAGVKHLSVHIYLVTSVYQVLQSTWAITVNSLRLRCGIRRVQYIWDIKFYVK